MILVVGDLMLDVFVLPTLQAPEQRTGLVVKGGGSAANTAAWIAHCGQPVAFIGCAGRDFQGRMLVAELGEQGVQPVVSLIPDADTGAVLVELTDDGEHVMRSSRGANLALSPDMLAAPLADQPRIVHITGYSLLNRYALDLLVAASGVAERNNARLSFDPSSVSAVHTLGRRRLLQALARCGVDVLLPNAAEACALAGTDDVDRAVADLTKLVPTVLVKLGEHGALTLSGGRLIRVPAVETRTVDTTGAGDAFNAGALVALLEGASVERACAAGNRVAALTIAKIGGRPG